MTIITFKSPISERFLRFGVVFHVLLPERTLNAAILSLEDPEFYRVPDGFRAIPHMHLLKNSLAVVVDRRNADE